MYQNIYIHREENGRKVYLWDDEKGLMTFPFHEFHYAYMDDPNGEFVSIYGDKLKKVKRWQEGSDIFESDVPAETRVLSDLYLHNDDVSKNHVIGFFDIEVDSEGGFATPETANKEITDIAFYNSVTKKYVNFSLDKDGLFNPKKTDELIFLPFKTEKELLKTFIKWYEMQKFTILTGWNVDGYDIPYLYRRLLMILGEESNHLSPIGIVKWDKRNERYRIAGVSVLDYQKLYRKFSNTPQPNYRLDTIGRHEVNLGKKEFAGSLADFRREDPEGFIEYNLNDVAIVVKLDEKLKYIGLVQQICHTGHVAYEDFEKSSRFIEGTILVYLHRKGLISPNRPAGGREEMDRREEEGEKGFEGAFVKDPVVGLHEWVYSLDLQSLYPSVLMSLNISPETKVGKIIDWDSEKYATGNMGVTDVVIQGDKTFLDNDGIRKLLDEFNLSVSSNGILYSMDKTGIIPEILDVWFAQRKEYQALKQKAGSEGDSEKESYYDRMQYTQKILLNSIYGVLGLPVFRFYDLDNAEAVTLTGQTVIRESVEYVNSIYNKRSADQHDHCIYVDTDSIYYSTKLLFPFNMESSFEAHKQFTIKMAQYVEKKLNDHYNNIAKNLFHLDKHRFVIRGETVAETGFWVTKKKYALKKAYNLEKNKDVSKGAPPAVKGLDTVRSSFPPAFSKFMKTILDMILNKCTKEELDSKITEFHSTIDTLPYSEIARNTSVQNIEKYMKSKYNGLLVHDKGTPAHIKAAITYNKFLKLKGIDHLYEPIRSGEKIKYVFLKQNEYQIPTIAFKGYRDPKEVIDLIERYIDYDALFEAELKNKLDDFYHVLGWNKIPTDVNQNATDFFSFG